MLPHLDTLFISQIIRVLPTYDDAAVLRGSWLLGALKRHKSRDPMEAMHGPCHDKLGVDNHYFLASRSERLRA
jgi:hypothetical protein